MQKLLAMLTTITSLSSITPMVLANAPVKIQENKIVNNEINYLKTNNLEKLNRTKRQNNKDEYENYEDIDLSNIFYQKYSFPLMISGRVLTRTIPRDIGVLTNNDSNTILEMLLYWFPFLEKIKSKLTIDSITNTSARVNYHSNINPKSYEINFNIRLGT